VEKILEFTGYVIGNFYQTWNSTVIVSYVPPSIPSVSCTYFPSLTCC